MHALRAFMLPLLLSSCLRVLHAHARNFRAACLPFLHPRLHPLWTDSVKTSGKIKAKKEARLDQARQRIDQDKNKNAEIHGHLSKANKIVCQELPDLLQACADDAIEKPCFLHPEGDLDFNRQFWPSLDDTRTRVT
jgi:hypothetical protein